jgi:hypothetical protein
MSSSSATETPSQVPSLVPESPSMNRGSAADGQSTESGGGGSLDFAISTSAGGIAKEPDSVNCGEPVVQRGEAPSMSIAQGASNTITQIPPTQVNTGGGAHFRTANFTGGSHTFGNNSIVNNNNNTVTFTTIRSGGEHDCQSLITTFTSQQAHVQLRWPIYRGSKEFGTLELYTQSKANSIYVDM